ncbi:hypothetical protein [Homoserinimonas sp. OAct 916]|uniref:hypothetical protein n=1 Tax=Homoserinimonas sp. OAct 916 TaxID=2211450 RepID=UPI000DBE74C7|nr:hypothetical protein [Homoserinimonas sp. OAct 916]
MDHETVLDLVKQEGLEKYARFGRPDAGSANKVCLFHDGARWVIVITDERAVVQERTIREFDSEPDALTYMVGALRVMKGYLEFSR